MSAGFKGMFYGASIAGMATATNSFGLSFATGIGATIIPGIATTAAAKAAIAAAVFSGSFILSLASVPAIGGLLCFALYTQQPKYLGLAMILSTAYMLISAGIGAAAISATGTTVTFATAAICALTGVGAVMLAAAMLTATAMSLCACAAEDLMRTNSGLHGSSRDSFIGC